MFPFAASSGDTLFEDLHHQSYGSSDWLADQEMEELGHYHMPPNHKIIFLPYLFQDFEKQVVTPGRGEKLLAAITSAGDEVSLP